MGQGGGASGWSMGEEMVAMERNWEGLVGGIWGGDGGNGEELVDKGEGLVCGQGGGAGGWNIGEGMVAMERNW